MARLTLRGSVRYVVGFCAVGLLFQLAFFTTRNYINVNISFKNGDSHHHMIPSMNSINMHALSSSTITSNSTNLLNSTNSSNSNNLKVPENSTLSENEVMADFRRIQADRMENYRKVCGQEKVKKVTRSSFASLMVDSAHEVFYCAVGKIGSTSWTTFMLEQSNQHNVPLKNHGKLINSKALPLTYITQKTESEAQKIFTSYWGFLFGRNPWIRLLSAFNDKFANDPGRAYYHNLYGKGIIKRYRKNPSKQSLSKGNDVTFPEFIAYLVGEIKSHKPLDAHWKPVSQVCHPCDVNYSFLGHLEDVKQEEMLVLEEGFKHGAKIAMPEVHRKKAADTDDIIAAAYREIPTAHIDTIRDLYRLDFQIFNYATDIPGLSN